MDLVAEMILDHLAHRPGDVLADRIRPPWRDRLVRLPAVGGRGVAYNADRVLNRYLDYPAQVRRIAAAAKHDLFHLVDHSYAQVLRVLPPGRSVATCHDLDTFRCLLDPAAEPRPRWFRALARRTLEGLQAAAAVACVSEATRAAILRHGLLPEEKLRVVRLAVYPECSHLPSPEHDRRGRRVARADRARRPARDPARRLEHPPQADRCPPERLRRHPPRDPRARLVKVGGRFTPEQEALAESLGIVDAIEIMPHSPTAATLAAVYRRAALALQTSDAEGFGLPVAEAMACGAGRPGQRPARAPRGRRRRGPLPRRSATSPAGSRRPSACSRRGAIGPPSGASRRDAGIAHAARFAWPTHVDILIQMYRDVLAGRPVARAEDARVGPITELMSQRGSG